MQNPFPVYHSPRNNHQLLSICYFTCVTKIKHQFVLLSNAVDLAGLVSVSHCLVSVSVLVSQSSNLINKPGDNQHGWLYTGIPHARCAIVERCVYKTMQAAE